MALAIESLEPRDLVDGRYLKFRQTIVEDPARVRTAADRQPSATGPIAQGS